MAAPIRNKSFIFKKIPGGPIRLDEDIVCGDRPIRLGSTSTDEKAR